MPSFNIQFVGVTEVAKWAPSSRLDVSPDEPLEIAILDKGTASGAPSVMLRIPLPVLGYEGHGAVAIVQTTGRIWLAAAAAIVGRYPELVEDGHPMSILGKCDVSAARTALRELFITAMGNDFANEHELRRHHDALDGILDTITDRLSE